MSLMIVYDNDAGVTQRRFMAMEREDLKHRSDVERLMNSLVPRGWGRSRWDRKPRSVPKPPPLKLCSFCDELKMKPEFSRQNWAKDEAAGCRCCMVRRIDDQKSRKEARASDFKATFVYPAPLTAGRVIAEEAVSQVGDLPDSEKPKARGRWKGVVLDSRSRRPSTKKEVAQGSSSGAALSKTQKKNMKKRQRSRQVRDGYVCIEHMYEDVPNFGRWDCYDELLSVYAGPSIYHSHAPVEGTVEIGERSTKALRCGEDIKIYGPAVMDDGGPTGDGEERFWLLVQDLATP